MKKFTMTQDGAQVVQINKEAWELYMEWLTYDISGEDPVVVDPVTLVGATLLIEKQIGDTDSYMQVGETAIDLTADTYLTPTLLVGGRLRLTLTNLPADHRLVGFISQRY